MLSHYTSLFDDSEFIHVLGVVVLANEQAFITVTRPTKRIEKTKQTDKQIKP